MSQVTYSVSWLLKEACQTEIQSQFSVSFNPQPASTELPVTQEEEINKYTNLLQFSNLVLLLFLHFLYHNRNSFSFVFCIIIFLLLDLCDFEPSFQQRLMLQCPLADKRISNVSRDRLAHMEVSLKYAPTESFFFDPLHESFVVQIRHNHR